jgi:LDH2 family malate/lactate/ureidoglycolate dehydrogenase
VPARVEVLVPARQYDRAYQRAQQEGISVPALLRRGLRRELAPDADDE